MSPADPNEDAARNLSREEMMSALFAHLVIQNTNMALMFLGKVPNPQTEERMYDIETARMFIDQLEMLEVKTRGNLSREEEKLLQQSLTHLRLSFVDAVEHPPQPETAAGDAGPGKIDPAAEAKPAEPAIQGTSDAALPDADAEARKKFSKKY
jgi:hypothetical protein